ncbi:hypothetical protein H6F67_03075 [Microcoleus sp. FACHB-1515]|uniref:hypothetical protein n=1 Tax=Cyanophyceae TaxID=3028117 RepID=UPI00168823FB|nr:hypothetical protein [Microcoleus sp. FACHB-1515]MBD2088836.1 hypothetical protein [Microcoleus sp. FACHB-1515]
MTIQLNPTFQLQQVPIDHLEPDFYLDPNRCTLDDAVQQLAIDPQSNIPFIVWLFEDSSSAIAFPGKINLYGHDCLHAILNRGHSLADEAFVKGFTMGSDTRTHWLHQLLFKLISSTLYPKKYRFSWSDFHCFDAGLAYGRSLQVRDLNRFDFSANRNFTISQVRQQFGIS